MASRHDLRKAYRENGRQAPVSGSHQYLDYAGGDPARHGPDGNQDPRRNETPGYEPGTDPATRSNSAAHSFGITTTAFGFRRARFAGFLHQRLTQSSRRGE